MATYLIADITVHDPERYQDYVRQVPAFIDKHQGSYVVRGGSRNPGKETGGHSGLSCWNFPTGNTPMPFLMTRSIRLWRQYGMPPPALTWSWLKDLTVNKVLTAAVVKKAGDI